MNRQGKIQGISIILPAWNEADNLPGTIDKLSHLLDKQVEHFEIIVINDGSTDDTEKVLKKLSLEYRFLKWINLDENKGYGAAIRAGLSSASEDFIFITDADGQVDCSALPGLINEYKGWDLVIGYRPDRKDPLYRVIYGKIWNLLCRRLFKTDLRDVDCAFKLIRSAFLKNSVFQAYGAMISVELVTCIKKQQGIILEIPVNHFSRKYGKSSGGSLRVIIRAFKELTTLYPSLRSR